MTLERSTLREDEPMGAPESLSIAERVVPSPATGRFVPLPAEIFTTEGEWVEPGQALAEVHNDSEVTPVRSSFRGWVMGSLASPGQPVREGDALFWIHTC